MNAAKRRITVVLDIALETEEDMLIEELASVLAEEIDLMLPRVSIWRGQEQGYDSADVTRVAVQRFSEQSPR
jgi:hypothetical protein